MKRLALIVLASCFAVSAAGQPTPPVKPGLWEVDGELTLSGPEANSPMARMMKALGKPVKHTECVTPEQAARGPSAVVYFDDGPNCAEENTHMEGGELVFTHVCQDKGKPGPPNAVRISAKPDEIRAQTDGWLTAGLRMQTRGVWRRIGDCPAR